MAPQGPEIGALGAEGSLALRLARRMTDQSPQSATPRPIFVSASSLSGIIDRELLAEGDAELRRIGRVLTADRLTYWPVEDEAEALGNVRLEQGDDVFLGTHGRLKIEDQVGFLDQASYFLKRTPAAGSAAGGSTVVQARAIDDESDEAETGFATPRALTIKPGQTEIKASHKQRTLISEARGDADRVDLEGENQYRLTRATFTTCKPGNDDWYLSAEDLRLDYDNEVGTGDDATLRFLGVPILHSPWISFSLSDEPKSGFLIPAFGTSSTSGMELAVPYYWRIAPNMDSTIEPRILSKRGLLLGADFRYLDLLDGGPYRGRAHVEFLPNDRQTNTNRWAVNLLHTQSATASGFSGSINYTKVSDNDYFTDLTNQITSTSQTQLLQQGVISYGGMGWWTATTTVQSFQTLQPDPQNPVAKPYRLYPQLTFNARQPDLLGTDSAFFGQYTHFVHPDPTMVDGQRTVLQPQVSLPYVTPGWYVTPRAGVNVTHYSLTQPVSAVGAPDSINRTLPIMSVDSGMIFERSTNLFGREYAQTLEPRLMYLYIPYTDQNNIPVFDTALADFNFAQIFADNRFSGWDRINNANQLTAALSSRLIDPASGAEIMRGMIGEIFYFTPNKVVLPGTTNPQWDKSDFLAAFSGQVYPKVYADAALQYNIGDQQFQRYALGARYVPELGKVLNALYSYNNQTSPQINQVDISGQWPISGHWQAVGRYNYSFVNDNPVEIIGGLEYNAGCWALRTVAHRVQTTQSSSSTQFFVQLELTGLAGLGNNPLNFLQRRIPGYAVGPVQTDRALGD